jgi:hypothetical protein
MKIGTSNSKSFESHPEYSGQAVCVDVTPLKSVQTDYGPKEQFKLVFETTEMRQDGKPYLVWSRGFTPSLGEKAALRGFLKQWLGRELTAAEEQEFDTETLIGRPASLVIVHNEGRNGETYANIGLIRPDKSATPLSPSGKYVRVKDRQDKDATFSRVAQPARQAEPAQGAPASNGWEFTKVHVGRHKGVELCELDTTAVKSLYENWLPIARAMDKPLKADRDLMAALDQAAVQLGFNPPQQPEDNELPY